MDVAHPLEDHSTVGHLRPGPLADKVARGALIFGLLGFGSGSYVAPFLCIPFDAGQQWNFTGGGALVGMIIGAVLAYRHQS